MVGLIVAAVLGWVAACCSVPRARSTPEIKAGFALVRRRCMSAMLLSRQRSGVRPRCNALRSEAAVPGWMWRPGAVGILRRVPGRRQGS